MAKGGEIPRPPRRLPEWAFFPTLLIWVLVTVLGFFAQVCTGIYHLANGDLSAGLLYIVLGVGWLYGGSWIWAKAIDP